MTAVVGFGPRHYEALEAKTYVSVALVALDGTTPITTYDSAGTTPTPITVDVQSGYLAFFATPGTYELQFTLSDHTSPIVTKVSLTAAPAASAPVSTLQQAAIDSAAASAQAAAISAAATDAASRVASEASARNTAITNAINGLLNGAPGALDTLKELADAINDDASFAATVTTALSARAPLVTPDADTATSGALSANKHNYVSTAGGAVSRALPTGQALGTTVVVENADGISTFNVTGNIRGTASSQLTLKLAHEIIGFVADSAGSWWPMHDHKTLSSLDARYAPRNLPTGITGTGVFDAATSVYRASSAVASNVRARAATATRGVAGNGKVAIIGDSGAAGFSPPATVGRATTSSAAQLAQLLAVAGAPGAGGAGVLVDQSNPDPRWAFAGTWTWVTLNNSKTINSGAASSTATYTETVRGVSGEYGYYDGAASRTFKLTVDGAILPANQVALASGSYNATTGVVTPGASSSVKVIRFSGLSNTIHTLVVTAQVAAATLPLWAEFYPAASLSVATFGQGGTSVVGANGNPKWDSVAAGYELLPTAMAYGADTYVIMLGGNDMITGTTTTSLQTGLGNIITSIQANNANAQVVLVAPQQFFYTAGVQPTLAQRQVYYNLADTYGCTVLDLTDRWGVYTRSSALGLLGNDTELGSTYYVHALPAGYLDVARGLYDSFRMSSAASSLYVSKDTSSGFVPDAAMSPRWKVPKAQGAVCFTFDDGYSYYDSIRQVMNANGQRGTFYVSSDYIDGGGTKITSAQLLALANDGHEIGDHGKTHSNLTGVAASTLGAELDSSKTAIEAIIGAGKVNAFAYPFGATGRNTTLDLEVASRYFSARSVANFVGDGQPMFLFRSDRPGEMTPLIAAYPWGTSYPGDADNTRSHANVLNYIRLAAKHPVIFILLAHDPVVIGPPTDAQIREALSLAASLGVPALTVSEAFGYSTPVLDPGFEDTTMAAWLKQGTAAETANIVTDTALTGYYGSTSLHLNVANIANNVYVSQAVPIIPGRAYTFGGHARVVGLSAGSPGLVPRLRWKNFDGTTTINSINGTALTSTNNGASYAPISVTATAPVNAAYAQLDWLLNGVTGDAYVSHCFLQGNEAGAFG